MPLRTKLSKFIRSIGGYALISNVCALALVLLVVLGEMGPAAGAVLWVFVAALEFVTRGHLRTLSTMGIRDVLLARRDWHLLATGHATRVLGSAAAIVFAFQQTTSTYLRCLSIMIALVVLAEPITASFMRKASATFANLPWRNELPRQMHLRFHAYVCNVLLIAGSFLLTFGPGSRVITIVLLVSTLALQLVMIIRSTQRMQQKQAFETSLADDLVAYGPKFYFYWDAPAGTAFQATMWLPYLERLGEKFCVVLRNTANFYDLKQATDVPIIVRPAMADLDALVVPSVRATFYVNNAIRNAHFARFLEITHIQLNHGDSDKPPSFNPVMRMYDRNFVAGPAAIERYVSRGIETSANFFEIVGRPQIEDIKVSAADAGEPQTIVYAPTWAGFMADSALSSLPIGPAMISELVSRGKRVIFRPHPHSRKNPDLSRACDEIAAPLDQDNKAHSRGHLFGEHAENVMSIVDCFNESDAMIADVSSVVPDYLYSTKPFAVVAMGFETVSEFLEENPVARAGYVIERDGANVAEAIENLLNGDVLRQTRVDFKADYLGDFNDSPYSKRFLEIARSYLN